MDRVVEKMEEIEELFDCFDLFDIFDEECLNDLLVEFCVNFYVIFGS